MSSVQELPARDQELLEEVRGKILSGVDAKLQEHRTAIDRLVRERLARPPGALANSAGGESENTAGRLFVRSTEFDGWTKSAGQRGRCVVKVPLSTKAATNIITSTTAPPGAIRVPDVYGPAFPIPAMLALIPTRPTGGDKVSYLRLKSRPTPGAKSQFPQGAAKAEQSFDVEEVEVTVATIACWTSASTQVLSDVAQLEQFIDGTLVGLTLDETDRQTLLGGGSTVGELTGLLAAATPYNAAANQTGDTVLDILSHAQLQLAAAGILANAAVVGPADAEKARLVKDSTGGYILQQPTTGALPNLWSMTIAVDVHMPANQFLVGRFASDSIELLDRQTALVEASREHNDYFVRNLVALRCELRAALALYWPAAFVAGAFPTTP